MINPISDNIEYLAQKTAEIDDDDPSNTRWHTILRKMSIIGTPESINSGTRETKDVIVEDTTLPAVQEFIERNTNDEISCIENSIETNREMSFETDAKLQWKRSFEKIKMINHMRKYTDVDTISKLPLAPYYPPAFIPPYLALFSKDEYGRKPPPILFDALSCAITDSIIDQNATHRLWTFRIELHYGDIKWVIYRTIIEFYNLYLTLKFKYISGLISDPPPPSFPSQLAHLTNAALTSMRIAREEDDSRWRDVALKRRDALEGYLKELVNRASVAVDYELCEFLEISAVSIQKDMGWKGKEGYLEYMAHPTRLPWSHQQWKKEWVILRDSYIAFCEDVGSRSLSDVFLFDKFFHVSKKGQGNFGSVHLTLSNSTRRIEIKGPASRHMDEWTESLDKIQKESPWVMNHRFGSFAPIREYVKAKWFVDGHDYYEAVAQAILSAKSEIYIEDWWLSPQLYLRRPPKGNEEYRLDRLLKRKACEGVMIYIVLYKNVSVALPLDSQYTRDWMQAVHPNIIVQRHSNLAYSPLWAHHEKILVIDYRLAFVGGLDLCFGRYDTLHHELTDYGFNDATREVFPGQDYSNPRIKDFQKVSQYDNELVDKLTTARMPWHDIHTAMVGPPARDIARHFVQRWNFIKKSKEREEIPFLLPKGEYVSSRDESKFKGTCRIQVLRSSAEWSQGIKREVDKPKASRILLTGKKYSIYNAYMECIFKAKHFIYIENQFFITTTSPDDKLIKNKIGQAIVERIKRAHKENQQFRVIVVIPSAPGFEGDFVQVDRRSMPLRSVAQYQYRSISRSKHSIFEQLEQANIPIDRYIGFYSLRNWGKVKRPLNSPNVLLDGKKKRRSRSRSNTVSDESHVDPQFVYPDDGRTDYVTEQVYIHSKLMIVDDKTVICGSANLNDRSQLGNRDSEIAVIIEDTDTVESKMNGQPYKASRYAFTLRMQLFKEHLGLVNTSVSKAFNYEQRQNIAVMDPLDDGFYYNVWKRTAERNTSIYRELFKCVPDDTVHSVEQHRHFVPDSTHVLQGHVAEPWKYSAKEIQSKLNEIQGHLVQFPTKYLKNISMTASVMQEAIPPIVFT
ncbi:hypothetical protein G6F47_007715 [Rhizopus delemar]|uniref:Phospholipase n=2 Tax=Rhizopus TaxID=4842 RepID=A0A9P6YC58_RHIOR|nr:hypothetical protein G6F53_005553 [Rhizopus delemar]KAG1543841.1 hypothetical protein G6F51_006428 [Rhizopus arrhizus]KAG1524527.1 hypothetical protein G6F52_004118 [Rhizopus delemar]KAG1595612.1 hypothetical protein G6F48_000560 [Rhizopus delemar]KAG1596978.1 hypothetical protein G6F47_007715 [Rhizopus delemar]